MKIKITSGNLSVIAELKNTPTAKAIYNVLHIEGSANRWGDEIYFVIQLLSENITLAGFIRGFLG